MSDTKLIVAIVASVLAIIGNISYLRDTLNNTIKPHPYTWFVWSIVSMTTFFGGLAKGAGIGALPKALPKDSRLLFLFFLLYPFSKIHQGVFVGLITTF